jgi:CxxC motif-containing protein
VDRSLVKRLPVRTREAIPKKKLFMAMNQLSKIRVKPPVKIGDVIISNLLNTGIDIIASDDLL